MRQEAFISYIDERNIQRNVNVTILKFDASFVQFKTVSGNVVFIPTARILKIKYKEKQG